MPLIHLNTHDKYSEMESGAQKLWNVMTNEIVMEKIATFLSDKDLVELCLVSRMTNKIMDQMDSSCWRKRAKKLQAVLRLDAEATDSTTYKQNYVVLKPKVTMLANGIKEKITKNLNVIELNPEGYLDENENAEAFSDLQELADIASLIYHNMLGEVSIKSLVLWDGDLSSIPTEQLVSLASGVTDQVCIRKETIILDQHVLLNNINSAEVEIMIDINQRNQTLGIDETSALIKAMEQRVEKVTFYNGMADVEALFSLYNGRKKCSEVRVVGFDSIEYRQCPELRKIAQNKNWDVDIKTGPRNIIQIILKRGQQEWQD